MADPRTAELQLGIRPVNNFPTTLKRTQRHAERERTNHTVICFPHRKNAELELGGPRVDSFGRLSGRIGQISVNSNPKVVAQDQNGQISI